MACESCPFAFTDLSEQAQNYACLPTPYEVIKMKRESGHNWGCHGNEKKICQGFAKFVNESQKYDFRDNLQDIDTSEGGLISYDTWYAKGREIAMAEAEENQNSRKVEKSLVRKELLLPVHT